MKKFILSLTALTLCAILAGCGNQGENAVAELGNQLDATSNAISTMQTTNPNSLNLSKDMLDAIATKENGRAIYANMLGTQQSLLNEEYVKTAILGRTAKIKNHLSKEIKLSKTQSAAVKELSDNLKQYTTLVTDTKADASNTLKSIANLRGSLDKNSDKINAKVNRLACNLNARLSFYENILSTLNQIEGYLGIDENSASENEINPIMFDENRNFENLNSQLNSKNDCNSQCQEENIANNSENPDDTSDDCENCKKSNEIVKTPYNTFNSNNVNRMNFAPYGNFNMPYGYAPYGPYGFGRANSFFSPYGFGYGANGFGYGMSGLGYGANGFAGVYGNPTNFGYNSNNINMGNRFIQNGNTDSYAPMVRNIDTYRINPTEEVAAVTEIPEKRLEDFEESNENNTLEKVEMKIKPVSRQKYNELDQPTHAV